MALVTNLLEDCAAPADRPVRPELAQDVPIVLYADEWGGVGGTAGYVVMLARGLRRQGYRVAAICHTGPGVATMRAQLAAVGVDVRAIEGDGDNSIRGRLRRFGRFVALIREYRGCIVAPMMGYFTRGGAVTLAAVLGRAGGVVRADLTPPEPPITRRQAISLRLKDLLTDRAVVGARENVDAFAQQIGRSRPKLAVIHTGIELGRFEPGAGRQGIRTELGFGPSTLVVGTTARLDDVRKGVDYFLQMAARVAPAAPRAQFLVVGDGVLRPGLEAQAEALRIRERVVFAGWRSDIPALLDGMDVFVMPSLFEGGPTSVLEAMAMARPPVASRVGMVPEVIEHGVSGLIVEPRDAVGLAEAVLMLLGDDAMRERMGAAARATALRDFSIDTMVDRYLELFADVHASGRLLGPHG